MLKRKTSVSMFYCINAYIHIMVTLTHFQNAAVIINLSNNIIKVLYFIQNVKSISALQFKFLETVSLTSLYTVGLYPPQQHHFTISPALKNYWYPRKRKR